MRVFSHKTRRDVVGRTLAPGVPCCRWQRSAPGLRDTVETVTSALSDCAIISPSSTWSAIVSFPAIPGYTTGGHRSLADVWERPSGDFPDELWPERELRRIVPDPTDWVVIAEHHFTDDAHGGVGSVLVDIDGGSVALEQDSWIGHDLGSVGIWGDGAFEDGLTISDRGIDVEFFCHVRNHHNVRLPSVEVSLPFLWYWDAIGDANKWFYLNRAGRDEELIRAEVREDFYRVQVKALELRQYLAARNLSLVVQHDFVPKTKRSDFSRVEAEYRSDWCNFTWVCTSEISLSTRPGFARLLGQYLIRPMSGSRVPRWEERKADRAYPEFQYAIDPTSGAPIRHTCDPDQLGTYFDDDNTRPHYLTPVYFRREVLGRYTSEPSRYRVTATRLSCLDLWGVDISTNTADLVEVYLGDLGRDVPPDEWPHWLGHNVAPAGRMAEDRFRRDILNQPTASRDIPGDLRRARAEAVEASRGFFGVAMWKELRDPLRSEFDALHAPISSDSSALYAPVLTLTKALVDAIEPAQLKAYLGSEAQDLKQLQLLELLVQRLQGDDSIATAFKNLHHVRSAGGIAHFSGSSREKVLERVGIAGMGPPEAFDSICIQLTRALRQLSALLVATTSEM